MIGSARAALLPLLAPLLLSVDAQAWTHGENSTTGVCFFWTTRDVHYSLNEKGSSNAPIADVQAAVEASFQAWTDVACSDFSYTFDGLTPRDDVGFDPKATDNVNLVVWRDTLCEDVVPAGDPCLAELADSPFACADEYACWSHSSGIIALTSSNYDVGTGEMADADIELDEAPHADGSAPYVFTTIDSPACTSETETGCVSTDIRNTLTHESGHFLGLGHSPVPTATMFGSASLGETTKRDLDPDDIAAICTLYPTNEPPSTCTPSGHITIDAGKDVSGCQCAGSEILSPGLLLGLLALARPSRGRSRNA